MTQTTTHWTWFWQTWTLTESFKNLQTGSTWCSYPEASLINLRTNQQIPMKIYKRHKAKSHLEWNKLWLGSLRTWTRKYRRDARVAKFQMKELVEMRLEVELLSTIPQNNQLRNNHNNRKSHPLYLIRTPTNSPLAASRCNRRHNNPEFAVITPLWMSQFATLSRILMNLLTWTSLLFAIRSHKFKVSARDRGLNAEIPNCSTTCRATKTRIFMDGSSLINNPCNKWW